MFKLKGDLVFLSKDHPLVVMETIGKGIENFEKLINLQAYGKPFFTEDEQKTLHNKAMALVEKVFNNISDVAKPTSEVSAEKEKALGGYYLQIQSYLKKWGLPETSDPQLAQTILQSKSSEDLYSLYKEYMAMTGQAEAWLKNMEGFNISASDSKQKLINFCNTEMEKEVIVTENGITVK